VKIWKDCVDKLDTWKISPKTHIWGLHIIWLRFVAAADASINPNGNGNGWRCCSCSTVPLAVPLPIQLQ